MAIYLGHNVKCIVTLTLIPQCPTLNSSKIFSYPTACFNFIFLTRNQTFCIVINAETFKMPTVTLTLIAQWPVSKHVRAVII